MDRQLFILGQLRQQPMHGYQIQEAMKSHAGLAINIKKGTLYDLLKSFQAQGWITHRSEKIGRRPTRRVYSLTPSGETRFQDLLRDRLQSYPTPNVPAAISLGWLHLIPKDEAILLLEKRRQIIAERAQDIHAARARDYKDIYDPIVLLGVVYMQNFYSLELEWLDDVLDLLGT